MNKKTNLSTIVLAVVLISLITSCNNNEEEAERKMEGGKDITQEVIDTTKTEAIGEDISYILPSPMQIATIFKKSGLKYMSGITNPVNNVNKYKTGSNTVKAINLGVYSADLSYCILNKQTDESKSYFKASRDLAVEIGLSKAFEANNLAQRMEKNMNKDDSIIKYLGEIQMQTDNTLQENKQDHISVISFAGAWVEGMYIGIRVQDKGKNTGVSAKLIEQMTIAENIIKALKVHISKEPDISTLIEQLNSLNGIYNNFKSIKEIKATDPDVIDPSKVIITDEELDNFTKKVIEIRNAFVKG